MADGASAVAPTVAPDGKWRRARSDAAPQLAPPVPGDSGERLAQVAALPYLQGYRRASGNSGVVLYDRGAAQPGWNLYVSGHAAEAVLMDMDGRTAHRWAAPLRRVFPDLAADPESAKVEYFRRARLLPDGGLLAIYEGQGLVRLDRDSHVLWAHRGGIHHDLDLAPDGTIWVLDRTGKLIPRINPRAGVLEDFVTALAPDGTPRQRISILEAFERSPYASFLTGMLREGDIFHTNTLELLDGRLAERHPAFRAGNILLSVLELNAIAVLDPRQGRIVWALRGPWRKQHQPTVLDGGRLLLFDNLGAAPDRSRVLELDPGSGAVLWHYGGEPQVDLFSKTLGSCQRLANGDTLITESENGRALEVTRDGRRVWEFRSPHRAGEHGELVATLFEVERLPHDAWRRGPSAPTNRPGG